MAEAEFKLGVPRDPAQAMGGNSDDQIPARDHRGRIRSYTCLPHAGDGLGSRPPSRRRLSRLPPPRGE